MNYNVGKIKDWHVNHCIEKTKSFLTFSCFFFFCGYNVNGNNTPNFFSLPLSLYLSPTNGNKTWWWASYYLILLGEAVSPNLLWGSFGLQCGPLRSINRIGPKFPLTMNWGPNTVLGVTNRCLRVMRPCFSSKWALIF